MTLRFSFLAALIFVAVLVACGGETSTDTPAPEPTAVSAISAPTEAPPTPATATESRTVAPAPTPTQEPTPTAVPESTEEPETDEPTPTAVPDSTEEPETEEPTATPPETEALDPALAAASEEVYALVVELAEELGHRVGGTPEERQAAESLMARLDSLGYSAELQTFDSEFFDFAALVAGLATGATDVAAVALEAPVQARVPGIPITSLPNGQMNSGSFMLVDLTEGSVPQVGELDGKIAFLWMDEIKLGDPSVVASLQQQVHQVAGAGAVAAVISSSEIGFVGYQPLFGIRSPIPALVVPPQAANLIVEQLNNGVAVVGSVQIQIQQLESQNVMAELEGTGGSVIVVGAHYDVVPQTESGPNDNTSGTAIVLSLAKALAGESLPFTVRFILFGAEEQGLFGSLHYVSSLDESEIAQMRAMVNFDVVGTGPFIAVVGDDLLTMLALEMASTLNIEAQIGMPPPGATSDHQSFEAAGVPVLMFFAPDVSRIHTANDTLEHVQPERLGEAFLIAETMLRLPE